MKVSPFYYVIIVYLLSLDFVCTWQLNVNQINKCTGINFKTID